MADKNQLGGRGYSRMCRLYETEIFLYVRL
jgi:hypothetical protein